MRQSLGRFLKQSVKLVTLLLLAQSSSFVFFSGYAGADEYEELGLQLISISQDLTATADDEQERRSQINLQVIELEKALREKSIGLEEAQKKVGSLEVINTETKMKESEIRDKYAQVNANFKKYVFQKRLQAIIPFAFSIAAVSKSDGDFDEKALYALAGYGTGALIENTGYGVSAGITWLWFERKF